ncbi:MULTISPECIES: DUF4238 domain-containing protein [Nocardia]|uniref:DUF4238 domain-containing protein n=2 Tax=Nocardia TaxID=1817 RepID=A0A7G1KG41_9NOCA|nr:MULTISPECIES: DUF4238 domain-containing protein [Nocardia]MBF6143655.1 DUF4238 domain-containing protein [Nocardia farcinica]MBF6216235.1 DUF4238 domain-containing protein [Nocardia puris]MBF6259797.1 DUF4238 domain-containing protein [Nocardia farcinica]MBF6271353.1 DUF4238 domain-containing protein [Nocardia farcinica]MBF6295430.1 DUF4238 domain-containing protein [Nocardia farcinica]
MTTVNRWLTDVEIEKSKEETRKNAQTTFRHHYVPRMYLKRWTTDGSGEIQVTNVDTKESNCVPIESTAVEDNFYQISAPDIDADANPDMWFETHMGRIEGRAANWLRALDGQPDGRIKDKNLISNLAVYISLQSQRTQRGRQTDVGIDAAVNRYGASHILNITGLLPILCREYGIEYSEARHQAIVNQILAKRAVSSETKPKAIDAAIGAWKNVLAPLIENDRDYWLASSTGDLLTCDEPVLGIPTKRNTRQFPVSIRNSEIIVFPISPNRLLILSRKNVKIKPPFELSSTEAKFLNREFCYNCNRLVFEKSGTSIASQIQIPNYPEKQDWSSSITSAPEFARAVLLPTRWTDAPHSPQWPLSRWTTD